MVGSAFALELAAEIAHLATLNGPFAAAVAVSLLKSILSTVEIAGKQPPPNHQ